MGIVSLFWCYRIGYQVRLSGFNIKKWRGVFHLAIFLILVIFLSFSTQSVYADGGTPPTEDETPLAEDGMPPVQDETLPVEDETTSVDGETEEVVTTPIETDSLSQVSTDKCADNFSNSGEGEEAADCVKNIVTYDEGEVDTLGTDSESPDPTVDLPTDLDATEFDSTTSDVAIEPEVAGNNDEILIVEIIAEPLVLPDPQFCQDGSTPASVDTDGYPPCAEERTTIQDAIDDASDAEVAGTIYLEEGAIFTETLLIEDIGYDLTLSGGWDFSTDTLTGVSTLNGPISILNSSGSIKFENIIFGSNASFILDNATDVKIVDGDTDSVLVVDFQGTEPSNLTVDGGAGDDSLQINFGDNSSSVSGKVSYDGGTGYDSMAFTGGWFDNVSYMPSGPSSGAIDFGGMLAVTYDNIEPIDDFTFATNITYSGTTGDDSIEIKDSVLMADGSTLCSVACIEIASPQFENIIFANKTNVTVDGLDGNDTITVNITTTAAGLSSLTVQGGAGNDTINITSTAGGVSYTVDGGTGTDVLALYDIVNSVLNVETLDVLGLFRVTSPLAFNVLTNQIVSIWDGSSNADATVNILTIGADNISAFFGIGDGSPGSTGLSLTGVNFALALFQDVNDTARQWLSLLATSTSLAFLGIPGLTLASGTVRVEFNKAASDGTVVDYTPNSLTITTGASTSLDLDMAGEDGGLLAASGNLEIGVTDFVNLSGTFGFAKQGSDLIAVGENITARMEAGSVASVSLVDADFGFQTDGDSLVFELSNGTFSANISDLKSPEVTNLLVQYTSATGSVTAGTKISVGSVSYTFENDITNNTMTFAGDIKANLFDIFLVEGSFAVQRRTDQSIILSGGATVIANLLAIGMSNVTVFAGYDDIGLELTGVDLAIALWSEVGGSGRNWTSIMGNVTSAALVGIDILTLSASTVEILANKKASDNTVVDYFQDSGESDATNLTITVGPSDTVDFTIDDDLGDIVQVSVETATLGIDDLFYITGSFAFEKSSGGYELDVETGLNTTILEGNASLKTSLSNITGGADYTRIDNLPMDSLLIGMSDVSIFVGGDNSDSALFSIENISFGLGLFTSQVIADPDRVVPMMYALQASKTFTSNPAIDIEVLKISLTEIIFKLNGGNKWQGVSPSVSPYINFTDTPVDVPTGAAPVTLDYQSALIGIELVNPSLNVADFIYVSADSLLIEHQTDNVDVITGLTSSTVGNAKSGLDQIKGGTVASDYSKITGLGVNINLIAATNVDVLVGAATEADALFSITDVAFGLAMIKTTKAADPYQVVPSMFALNIVWDNPPDIDLAGLIVNVGSLAVEVNRGSKWKTGQPNPPAPFVDFVASFGADGLPLTSDGSLKADYDEALMRVTFKEVLIELSDFFYLRMHVFVLQKGSGMQVSGSTGIDGAFVLTNGLGAQLTPLTLGSTPILSADYKTFTNLQVDNYIFAGKNVQLFAGYGPYYRDSDGDGDIDGDDSPYADAIGFVLDNLNFGLAILKDPNKIFPIMYTFKGLASGIGLVGLDFLTLQASQIAVALNIGKEWVDKKDARPHVNWQTSFPNDPDGPPGYQIPETTTTFDFDQMAIKVAITDGKLSILDFFHLQGNFAFEKGATHPVYLKDDTGLIASNLLDDTYDVSTITLGGQDLSAFVGFGQIDENGQPTEGSVGISIQDLDFGFAFFKLVAASILPDKYKDKAVFVALNASLLQAGLVGIEDIAIATVYDVILQLNSLIAYVGGYTIPIPIYIDFKKSFETSTCTGDGVFEIQTGADPVTIDYDRWMIRVSVGFFEMKVYENLYLAGSLAIDLGEQMEVILTDGSQIDVMAMTFAAAGVYGFLGFNGPYWQDTNGDHRIDENDIPNTDAVGFTLENLNLAIVIMKSMPLATSAQIFFALKATLDMVGVVGITGLTIEARDLKVDVNLSIGTLNQVDFAASFPGEAAGVDDDGDGLLGEPPGFQVNTGADPVYLAYDDFLVEASGDLTINAFDALELYGIFYIKITKTELTLMANVAFKLQIGNVTLLQGTTNGTIRFIPEGFVGYVDLEVSFLEGSGFSMEGRFQFEINTTDSDQTIKRFEVDKNGQVGDLVDYTIEANSMYVSMAGKIILGGIFEVTGWVEIRLRTDSIEIALYGSMDLAGFGKITVSGSAGLYNEDGTLVLAGAINVHLKFELSFFETIKIEGDGYFEVNTSQGRDYDFRIVIDGVEKQITIPANSFLVRFQAEGRIAYVLKIRGDFKIEYQNGFFRIELTEVYLDFFGIVNIKLAGFIQSDGQFDFRGSIHYDWSIYVVSFNVDISFHVGDHDGYTDANGVEHKAFHGLSLHFSGSVSINLFIASASAGIDAELEVTPSYVYVALDLTLQVKINLLFYTIRFSVDFSWDHYWTWGDDKPVIARREGDDTVYLNFGADRDKLGGDYVNVTSDNVIIAPYGTNGIKVSALGAEMIFNNVAKIVVTDFQDGDDKLVVDEGVKADLYVYSAGDGDDTILYSGAGSAFIYGGAGNDILQGGYGNASLFGEEGDDTLKGGAGDTAFYGGTGNDILEGGTGDDIYYFEEGWGMDTVSEPPALYVPEDESEPIVWVDNGLDTLDFQAVESGITFLLDDTGIYIAVLDEELDLRSPDPDLITNPQAMVTVTGDLEILIGGSGADTFHAFNYEYPQVGSCQEDRLAVCADGRDGSDKYILHIRDDGNNPRLIPMDSGSAEDWDALLVDGTSGPDIINITSNEVSAGTEGTLPPDSNPPISYNEIDSGIELLAVYTFEDNDTVNIKSTPGPTWPNVIPPAVYVNGGTDDDIINVAGIYNPACETCCPDCSQGAAGFDGQDAVLTLIDGDPLNGALVIEGDEGHDILNVVNVDDTTDNTGVLTDHTIRGLSLTVGIDYTGVETLNLCLGSGDDEMTVESMMPGMTNIHAGEGNDTLVGPNTQYTNGEIENTPVPYKFWSILEQNAGQMYQFWGPDGLLALLENLQASGAIQHAGIYNSLRIKLQRALEYLAEGNYAFAAKLTWQVVENLDAPALRGQSTITNDSAWCPSITSLTFDACFDDPDCRASGLLTFSSFENITTGEGPDMIIFSDQMGIDGKLDGVGETEWEDWLNYQLYRTPARVNLKKGTATGAGSIANFEFVLNRGPLPKSFSWEPTVIESITNEYDDSQSSLLLEASAYDKPHRNEMIETLTNDQISVFQELGSSYPVMELTVIENLLITPLPGTTEVWISNEPVKKGAKSNLK